MKKIVICATQRSGSTMLCKELEATTVLGRPKEVYINPKVQNAAEAQNFVNRIVSQGQSENGLFAVKIMQDQWEKVDKVHSYLSPSSPPSLMQSLLYKLSFTKLIQTDPKLKLDSFHQFYQGATWVFLRRKEHLYQAISRDMASQTKVCHVVNTNDETKLQGIGKRGAIAMENAHDYNMKTQFDAKRLFNRIQSIVREEAGWERFFKKYQISPLELYYEDIVGNKDYLKELARQVEVKLPDTIPAIPLVKVGNQLNEEWAERFKQEYPQYA
ncbi:Stf0 family sulfotransferase [Thiothrix eikelboomii]|nr:Stf0 family sulfotransferase [Thiothrix eikelboomii]